jgi:tRNA(Arg) A34 adenosine deaminase TadA
MTEANDHAFLKRAVDLSFEHMRSGEGKPFGAVLVLDGRPLAEGWNSIFASNDPTAHAEIMAVRRACKVLNSADLSGATLYASGEPCPMCLGAMYLARVARCVYATTKEEATRIGNLTEAIYAEYPKRPADRTLPCIHMPIKEASAAFDEWLTRAH